MKPTAENEVVSLCQAELERILEGAAFLGSGGGGSIEVGQQLIKVIVSLTGESGVPMTLAPYDSVSDSALLAVAADVGAADTFVPHQDIATLNAFNLLESLQKGESFSYTVPVELGAENTLAAIAVAAHKGIGVIDGDGGRRAIPTISLATFAVSGIPVAPVAIASTGPSGVVLWDKDCPAIEGLMRPIISGGPFADSAGLALWSMTGAQLKQAIIPSTISLAYQVGQTLATVRQTGQDPAEALLALPGLTGRVLAQGTLKAGPETETGGFDFGVNFIEQADGTEVVVYNQNENLLAWQRNLPAPIGIAPDSLCYVSKDGHAFSNNEAPQYIGKEVYLIGLLAEARLREPDLLAAYQAALAALGFYGSYVPCCSSTS